jgi:hypothetical protein
MYNYSTILADQVHLLPQYYKKLVEQIVHRIISNESDAEYISVTSVRTLSINMLFKFTVSPLALLAQIIGLFTSLDGELKSINITQVYEPLVYLQGQYEYFLESSVSYIEAIKKCSNERASMLVIDPEMDLDDLFNQAGFNTSWVDISVKQSINKLVGGDGFLAALKPTRREILLTSFQQSELTAKTH